MNNRTFRTLAAAAAMLFAGVAGAGDTPQDTRHELMEGVGDGAKVIGGMLRGQRDYDADAVQESLSTFAAAAAEFGSLFPAGSADDTRAAPSIWEDRDGFNAALQKMADATATAIDAAPATLEDARPVLGPIFQTCKNCHDTYRLSDD